MARSGFEIQDRGSETAIARGLEAAGAAGRDRLALVRWLGFAPDVRRRHRAHTCTADRM